MEGDDFKGGIFSYAEFIIEKSHFVESNSLSLNLRQVVNHSIIPFIRGIVEQGESQYLYKGMIIFHYRKEEGEEERERVGQHFSWEQLQLRANKRGE